MGTISEMYAQGTDEWKAFATAQAIVSTIQGSINAYSSTAAIPIVGPALAPIAAGVAFAAGMIQVDKIQSTPVQSPVKHELGGVLRGASHAQGGIPINEAEGNEIILTKGVYQDPGLRSLASALNQAGGGRSFAPPIDPSSRGSVAAAIGGTSGGGVTPEHIQDFKKSVMALADSINGRIDRLKYITICRM